MVETRRSAKDMEKNCCILEVRLLVLADTLYLGVKERERSVNSQTLE